MGRTGVGASHKKLLLTTTMLVSALTGYGRRAYGACAPAGGSTYTCSGANLTGQAILVDQADVGTVAGFSVDTGDNFAINIEGDGTLFYVDDYASPLTATVTALRIVSNDSAGGMTVKTNGKLTGGVNGIYAYNSGGTFLHVTANGNVYGTAYAGILAANLGSEGTSVMTGAGTKVSGATGIIARNEGGALKITADGDVYGTSGAGIQAHNGGTSLTLTTGADTYVKGATDGIVASNYGSGALEITADGDVSGGGIGIRASNRGASLKVTTGVGTRILGGGTAGIHALNTNGNMQIDVKGDVNNDPAAGTYGVFLQNNATAAAATVTTGAGTTVKGADTGIQARNLGSGDLKITALGDVTGTNGNGIYAVNYQAGLSVTTGAGTTVTGGDTGILASNYGSGKLDITANGDVTGTSDFGIFAVNLNVASNGFDLSTAAGSTVRGGGFGIQGVHAGSGLFDITINGDVTGDTDDGIYAISAGSPIKIFIG